MRRGSSFSALSDQPQQHGEDDKGVIVLEESMSSLEEIQDLPSVSFCEKLHGEELLECIRAAVGPEVRAELAKHVERAATKRSTRGARVRQTRHPTWRSRCDGQLGCSLSATCLRRLP